MLASEDVLRLYDLNMLATAASYDLRYKSERLRSVADLEMLFFRLVRALGPDLFIEAGAKDGGASRRARRRCPHARVVAFEANPYTHKRFSKKNADPSLQIEYLHLALTDEPGSVVFNVRMTDDGRFSSDGQGSLYKRTDYAPGYAEVTVDATTIDHFFAEHSYERCAMWIDVEGASQQVLTGARGTLDKAAVAFIEVQDHPFWGQSWLRPEVAACFYDAGLVPVARDYQSPRQYNLMFLRNTLLDDVDVRLQLISHRRDAAAQPNEPPQVDALRRKARKLASEPARFFADSKSPLVRSLGKALWR